MLSYFLVLYLQGIHAINLGDSGFIVVRDGCTVFQSPVQQHDFNFTYQLASGNDSDPPSAGQVSCIIIFVFSMYKVFKNKLLNVYVKQLLPDSKLSGQL